MKKNKFIFLILVFISCSNRRYINVVNNTAFWTIGFIKIQDGPGQLVNVIQLENVLPGHVSDFEFIGKYESYIYIFARVEYYNQTNYFDFCDKDSMSDYKQVTFFSKDYYYSLVLNNINADSGSEIKWKIEKLYEKYR